VFNSLLPLVSIARLIVMDLLLLARFPVVLA
jgi:hypothetical protein